MNDVITIVSGLPRSGTSVMMGMLEAGGMDVAVDNIREADEDNPKGYYELEKVKDIKSDYSWLDNIQGKVVKMVSMLLYELPSTRDYNIIFMQRDIGEILASQRTMLQRKGNRSDINDEEMGKLFNRHLEEIENWLAGQKNMRVFYINYKNVIEDPRNIAQVINHFLNETLNIEKMVETVDRSLYRQRSALMKASDVITGTKESKNPLESVESVEKENDKEKIEAQLRALGYM
jgi:hypothetical protein